MSNFKTPFLVFNFLFLVLSAQEHNKLDERVKRVIDSTYNALLKKSKVVGASIAIVDNGEIVYSMGYGFADRENKITASDKTIYRIGSCTKSFTSLSILQLQEQKKLNIKNSVKEYLPELTIKSRFNDSNQIFIHDMMCHVSGLPCDISNGFFCDAPPKITWVIEELNKQTTISPRRYKNAYSNVAYGLLGEVVARESKSTYNNYVYENIFKPLEMNSSFIDMEEKFQKNISKGYFNNKEFKEPLIRDVAAGLIHSNVLDMANYIQFYLNKGTFNNKRVLSEESISDMKANHMKDVILSNTENWGYGLYTKAVWIKTGKDSMTANIIGHGGDTYAFHSDFGFIPELNVGFVILTNTDNGGMIRSINKLLKTYLKETKGKTVNFIYNDKSDSLASENEFPCKPEEIIGSYNMGDMLMQAKNDKKIKFKQGPTKIVLKQKKSQPNMYSIKAILFGVIPIKVKDQEFTFVKMNSEVFLKVLYTKTKKQEFIAVKSSSMPISNAWKEQFGNYKIINANYKCTDCPYGITEGMTLKLLEAKGFIQLKTRGKTPDTKGSVYANIISDNMAVSGGIGRGTGETIKILENGNIYYSGFEFKKVE